MKYILKNGDVVGEIKAPSWLESISDDKFLRKIRVFKSTWLPFFQELNEKYKGDDPEGIKINVSMIMDALFLDYLYSRWNEQIDITPDDKKKLIDHLINIGEESRRLLNVLERDGDYISSKSSRFGQYCSWRDESEMGDKYWSGDSSQEEKGLIHDDIYLVPHQIRRWVERSVEYWKTAKMDRQTKFNVSHLTLARGMLKLYYGVSGKRSKIPDLTKIGNFIKGEGIDEKMHGKSVVGKFQKTEIRENVAFYLCLRELLQLVGYSC